MNTRRVKYFCICVLSLLVSSCSDNLDDKISIGVYLEESYCSAEQPTCPARKHLDSLEKKLNDSEIVHEFNFVNSEESKEKFTESNADNPILLELAGDSFKEYFHAYIEPENEIEFRNEFDELSGVAQVAYVVY